MNTLLSESHDGRQKFLLPFRRRGLGEVFDAEGVIVVIPLAAVQDHFGDLFEGQIVKGLRLHPEGPAAHQKGSVRGTPLAGGFCT